jgi:hypothetical protein
MRVVAGALRELLGLFVEDAGYAFAILGWVAIASVAFRYVDPVWRGAVFAAGFIVVLLTGVIRATRAP